MQNEREDIFQPLKAIDYDIAGNSFRAYYDADNKLVFVLDFATSVIKPNVLLVINPDGDRKWDDILMNDYGVDLETVRPKQDNKYQKLDIEYTGLSVYDNLIRAYNNGDDLADVITYLDAFRHDAAYRAAQERFEAAEMTANRTRETIDRTMGVIAELQARVKVLRSKLALQRKSIGKEPTKKSASKILRTESQIDATNDKLMRAKKRLTNAKRRLIVAEEDSEVARSILNNLGGVAELPTKPINTTVAVKQVPPVSIKQQKNVEYTDTTIEAEEMADNNEEVKPLFDTDPEIIDEDIAFKPIDFGSDSGNDDYQANAPVEEITTAFEPIPGIPEVPSAVENPVAQPVEFTPPSDFGATDNSSAGYGTPGAFTPTPIIEEDTNDYETLTGWGDGNAGATGVNTSFSDTGTSETLAEEFQMPITPAPVAPVVPVNEYESPVSQIEAAPIDSGMRPVSPIVPDVPEETAGTDVNVSVARSKPSFLYYLLLIILIAMSVFTLWLYQKSTNGNLPELGAKTDVIENVAENVENAFDEEYTEPEFVADEPIVEHVVVEPEPIVEVEPIPEPEPVVEVEPIPEPEPVIEEPVNSFEEQDTEVIEDDTVSMGSASVIKSLRYTEEVTEPGIGETEEEILAKKPAYGVSQNDKMFVSEYDSDDDANAELDFVAYDTNVVSYTEPNVVSYKDTEIVEYNEPDTYTNDIFAEDVETCSDGQYPSPEGCCTGETYTHIGNGEYVCCDQSTGECFPPMR